uniref:Uncharacterized protein n=1 Tax=Arundo donax TaxID=35708 RepID=A0A0A8ZL93_ARUDO
MSKPLLICCAGCAHRSTNSRTRHP